MYSVRDGIVLRDVGGIYFLVDIRAKDYFEHQKLYAINNFAKNIFEIISATSCFTVDTIMEALSSQYEINNDLKKTVQQDVSGFISQLHSLGYIGGC